MTTTASRRQIKNLPVGTVIRTRNGMVEGTIIENGTVTTEYNRQIIGAKVQTARGVKALAGYVLVETVSAPGDYNAAAVQKAIDTSRKPISRKEGRLNHALLKGHR